MQISVRSSKKIDKKLAILNVLKEHEAPLTSSCILDLLSTSGLELSERTIRFYLAQTDQEGLTRPCGRKGRVLTEAGLAELQSSQVMYMPGYLSAKMDQMVYKMTFDLAMRSGTVVVNTSLVEPQKLASCLDKVCKVFEKGYGMGRLMTLLGPGETVGQITVPPDKIGFCTVCSITINGVLLKHGIPMSCRFGGLLMLKDGRPFRFTDVIHYDGTTIDPLEVFIRSGMTNYHGAISTGNGLIGASFREVPADSRQRLLNLSERLEEVGLGAIMEVGLPNQPLLDIPVAPARVGVIVVGGLNPIAILEEVEHRIVSRALAGLLEFDRLFDYRHAAKRLEQYL
ncbi:MAG: NrpR regulatory domain-containing protein [Sedimentisphaerales bacterium]|nr:NrpR regulatory domain-containing protein [Sedimentisphaerales bacterium]